MFFEALTALAVLGAAVLTTATIWSRRETWVRGAALAGFFVLAPVTGGAVLYALSHPAPYYPAITAPGGEYTVLGVKMVQDEAIYIWLDFGSDHPRYFALPWNNETANRLQEMLDAQRRGQIPGFKMSIPYEHSWDRNPPQFHPLPQPIIPIPKQRQQDDPLRHERAA